MKILAFSGSNSASSINQQLIEYTVKHLKTPVDVMDLRDYDIPLFGIDEENANGVPEALKLLYNILKNYDAYVIAIPEHNGNYPAFFKNIIDWLTRIERGFFNGKPVLLLNASPGQNGGKSVMRIAENSFPFFGGNVIDTFILSAFDVFWSNGGMDKSEVAISLKATINKYERSLTQLPTPHAAS